MIRLGRLLKSFAYAWRGLWKIFHEEQNLKIQAIVGIFAVILGIIYSINRYEWLALVMVIGLVIILETLNSAVERVTDVLKPRINNYVKEIKDIMAAAVMLASIVAVVVGLLIFLPRILT